ncbi:DNA replication complex GINS protein SLD5-like isoform X2 [Vitis vinifera]|uniref:Uncharacterized protein n=1 Tax=Vitis vinifera TaxID=29760 RepID=D7SYG0_VITVI
MASGSEEGSGFPADDYESLIATTDVELLKRAWRNEKAAPETLHFQTREQIQLMFRSHGWTPLSSAKAKDLSKLSSLMTAKKWWTWLLMIYTFFVTTQ